MEMESLLSRIKDILENKLYYDREGDKFSQEIYCDHNDYLSDNIIKKIMKHNDPMTALEKKLAEWAIYHEENTFPVLIEEIRKYLTDEEKTFYDENQYKIVEWLNENIYLYYPVEHFNQSVKVNIMVDTGDGNYDFSKNNVLNAHGDHGDGTFEETSSILWLAKTQGKEMELCEACKRVHKNDGDYVDRFKGSDEFIESVIQELENLSSYMSTLTFLVEMKLFDLFKLYNAIKAEEFVNDEYNALKSKGTGYITISKDTMCGLFDPWQGGGSILEIRLDKDVKLPIRYIWKADIDSATICYNIKDVYGLLDSCWYGTVKEIHPMETEIK